MSLPALCRRSILAVLVAPMLAGSAAIAQDPPIGRAVTRDPQLGVRTLLTSRGDDQLVSLLSRERTYRVYTFELRRGFDHARVRLWNGVLVMPREAELGPLTPISFAIPGDARVVDSWYQHPDGTISKILVNPGGRPVGVMSARNISMWAQLDLDDDGIVDFFRFIGLDGREIVAAAAGRGAAFLQRWRRGESQLCDPSDPSARAGIVDPAAGRGKSGSPFGAGHTPACSETGSGGGPLGGIVRGKKVSAPDPMDMVCAGRTGPARPPGPRTHPKDWLGNTGGIGSRRPEPRPAPTPSVTDRQVRELAGIIASRIAADLLKPPKTEKYPHRDATLESETPSGSRESPDAGSKGDGEAALNATCAARARAARHWLVTIEQAERQQKGAADTNCDDPVTDPAAADAGSVPKCGPSREGHSVSEQLLSGLGAYESRQCGRFEQPGPDGTCRGGRNIGSSRGQLWYGYGSVIGITPCPRSVCDPADIR